MISQNSYSVLIVEDERIVAKDLQQSLSGMGYDAFAIASSGDEAIAHASKKCPDVVLMDIRIKGKRDGIQTAEILRHRFGVPIVYLTAHADEATIERAQKTVPYGYLLKPVKTAELQSAIEVSVYRHAMEKRLRERERWFSTTLLAIADAVVTVDLAGNITFMNPAAEALTGAKAADAIGKPAQDILRLIDDKTAEPGDTPLATALREGRTVELQEGRLLNVSTGRQRIVSDSASPVVDQGKTLGAVMVFRDVTEQKLLQKQLELSDRLASLGTMAAGVAHEVNNPLAVVVANASFVHEEMARLLVGLRSGGSADEGSIRRLEGAMEAQAEAQSAATRIGRIVSDLNAFSRPVRQVAGEADVSRSVEWAIRSTAHELRHRARVTTTLTNLPLVAMDETRLGQVLVNLLVNAAHAISPGNVEGNHVSVNSRSVEGGRVTIEVRDTGCGMTPQVLERIFEPFFTTKSVGVGTGLGLAICHGIVASVGGELYAESEVGAGSVFRLVLSVATREPKRASIPVPPSVVERRARILVIDDEELVLRAIGRVLDEHQPVCTGSAREALKLLQHGEIFDVIFSDLMMPNMTGMEFYEELLRTRPEDARRVVFLSGGTVNAKVMDFLASVPNLRLGKPFDMDSLRTAVQEILAGHPRA